MEFLKRLFTSKSEFNLQEPLVRSERERNELEAYKHEGLFQTKFSAIADGLALEEKGIDQLEGVLRLRTPQSNGIVILKSHYNEHPLWCWQEVMKERILDLGYRVQNANRSYIEKGEKVLKTEKYYLKPPLSFEPPIKQEYGNVILDMEYQNDEEYLLKVQANIYTGFNYSTAKDFLELIDGVLR